MSIHAAKQQLADELEEFGSFVAQVRRDIHLRDVRTGRWYSKMLSAYVAYYEARRIRENKPPVDAAERPAQVVKFIERAALQSALTGAGAAAGVTAASIATSQTSGLAAPAVWPIAGAGIVGELVTRSVIHLRLACQIAELYGMPFQPGAETELIRIYALAIHAEMHETEDDPGRGLVERVLRLQDAGGLSKLIASGLIGETLLRNAIPFADIAVSSLRNWQLTHQVGAFVQAYATHRVHLDNAVDKVAQRSPVTVDLLVEGVWFIFISDGRLTGVETAVLAHLMREQSIDEDLTKHFVNDEASWLERLAKIDPDAETRRLVTRALEIAATMESPVTAAEATILRRVASLLGTELTVTVGTASEVSTETAAAQHAHGVGQAVGAALRFAVDRVAPLFDRIKEARADHGAQSASA